MTEKETSPAFQFYARDWLSSSKVQRMSMTERGVYQTLLAFEWLDGSLPTDMKQLAAMVGMKASQFQRMWSSGALCECFVERDGRFVNERLESERQKQRDFRRRQSDNGSKGGRPKPQAIRNPDDSQKNPGLTQVKARALKTEEEDRSSVQVAGCSEGGLGETDSPPMDRWLYALQNDLYPPHRVTRNARTTHAFFDAMAGFPGGPYAAWSHLQANLTANIASHEWASKGMVPSLEKYLADGLWRNVLPAAPPPSEPRRESSRVPTWAQ